MNKKQLLFGTIDTYLIWKLTKGKMHATDATNASRTMIYNITLNKWDDSILKLFKIPKHILPSVKDCSDDYGYTHHSYTNKPISINELYIYEIIINFICYLFLQFKFHLCQNFNQLIR